MNGFEPYINNFIKDENVSEIIDIRFVVLPMGTKKFNSLFAILIYK